MNHRSDETSYREGNATTGQSKHGGEVALTQTNRTPAIELANQLLADLQIGKQSLMHSVVPSLGAIDYVQVDNSFSRVAAASRNLVIVWDLQTKAVIHRLVGTSPFNSISFHPTQDDCLVTGEQGGRACFWSLLENRVVRQFDHHHPVKSVMVSDDGKILVSAAGRQAFLWSLDRGRIIQTLNCPQVVQSVYYCKRTRLGGVVLTEYESYCHMWSVGNNEPVYEYKLQPDEKAQDHLLATGKLAVSAQTGPYALLWSLDGMVLLRAYRHQDRVNQVYLDASSRQFATACDDGTVQLMVFDNPDSTRTFTTPYSQIKSLIYNSSCGLLLAGSSDHVVREWDIDTGNCKHLFCGPVTGTWHARFINDDKQLVVVGSHPDVKIYSTETGHCVAALKGHTDMVCGLAVNSNNKRFVTGSYDATLRIWDSDTCQCIQQVDTAQQIQLGVAINTTGSLVAGAGVDGIARIWRVDTGDQVSTFHCDSLPLRIVRFSNDGNHLYCAGKAGVIHIWNVNTGVLTNRLEAHDALIYAIEFSGDQTLMASSSEDRTVKLWRVNDHKLVYSLTGHQQAIRPLLFDQSNRYCYSGSFEPTIKRWDIHTGHCVATFIGGHDDRIRGLSLNGDGTLLASAGRDGKICFWDTGSGKLKATLHHVNEGFLWTTPSRGENHPGWIWTNREDLINICDVSGAEKSRIDGTLPLNSNERRQYLAVYNDQQRVMNQISPVRKTEEVHYERLVDVKKAQWSLREESKRLCVD